MRFALFFGVSAASSHSNSSAATRESSVGIEGLTLKDLGLDLDFLASCYAPRQDEFVATHPVPGRQSLEHPGGSGEAKSESKSNKPQKQPYRAFSLDFSAVRPELKQEETKANRGKKTGANFSAASEGIRQEPP